jgi:hypothetical protein
MEILLIVVLIGAALWFIGGMVNAQPLNKWSNEKLERMHAKHMRYAATLMPEVTFDEDKIARYKAAQAKADAILAEIDRRKSWS